MAAYLALFAMPMLSPKARGLRPGRWLRVASASSFLMMLLYVILSIFPIIDVQNSWRYSVKIAAVALGANIVGWMIYHVAMGSQGPRPVAENATRTGHPREV